MDSEYFIIFHRFIRIVVDGELSEGLRPWIVGGMSVGVGKVDKSGFPLALDQDARPTIMERVFRKFAFNCSFRFGSITIKARFLPRQLVIVVAGGTEVLVHSIRIWRAQSKCPGYDSLIEGYEKDIQYYSSPRIPHRL